MFELKGTLVGFLPSVSDAFKNRWIFTKSEKKIYGESIDELIEDAEGKLWAVCSDEPQATQINFNPFTGEPAKKMRSDYK